MGCADPRHRVHPHQCPIELSRKKRSGGGGVSLARHLQIVLFVPGKIKVDDGRLLDRNGGININGIEARTMCQHLN